MSGLRRKCSLCAADAMSVRGKLALCERHEALAGEVLLEARNVGLQALGAYVEKKAPVMFGAAKAAFETFRVARAKNGHGDPA